MSKKLFKERPNTIARTTEITVQNSIFFDK